MEYFFEWKFISYQFLQIPIGTKYDSRLESRASIFEPQIDVGGVLRLFIKRITHHALFISDESSRKHYSKTPTCAATGSRDESCRVRDWESLDWYRTDQWCDALRTSKTGILGRTKAFYTSIFVWFLPYLLSDKSFIGAAAQKNLVPTLINLNHTFLCYQLNFDRDLNKNKMVILRNVRVPRTWKFSTLNLWVTTWPTNTLDKLIKPIFVASRIQPAYSICARVPNLPISAHE